MIPVLYESTETAFQSEGLCRLTDVTRCIVTEELNGIYTIEFDYPTSGANFDQITEGRIVACIHDDKKDVQPFDIIGRSAPIEGVVTFYGQHISYRLSQIVVRPYTATSCTQALDRLVTEALVTNPFSFYTDKSVTADFAVTVPSSVRSLLGGSSGSILDTYGKGEYEFNKWTVRFLTNRGVDNGVEIRYGKNLLDLTYKTDISEDYDAVAPFWQATDGNSTVTLPEGKIVRTGHPVGGRVRCIPLDLSSAFEEQPTVAELRALATARLNNSDAWVMEENITLDFIQLWQTEDYKDYAALERVSLGDKVSVIHPVLGVSANRIEVIRVSYDVLAERYASMELGKKQSTFAEKILERTVDEVMQVVPDRNAMAAAIEYATSAITGNKGGNIVIKRDANGKPIELLIMDTEDTATAVNVWRWNLSGLGHSSTGYNGPFNDVAITADGKINASMITVGVLNAIRIVNGNNFIVESDGTVTARAINITGGSVRITTTAENYDVIELSYAFTDGSGTVIKSRYSPLGINLENSGTGISYASQAGGQSYYLNNAIRMSLTPYALALFDGNSTNIRALLSSTESSLRDSAGTIRARQTVDSHVIQDADGVARATRTGTQTLFKSASGVSRGYYGIDSLIYYDANGKQRVSLGNTNFTLKDTAETNRFMLQAALIQMWNASGQERMRLSSYDRKFTDDSGYQRVYETIGTYKMLDSTGTERILVTEDGGVKVKNSSGQVVSECGVNGLNICNTGMGLLIDGAGYANGTWSFKTFTAKDGNDYNVPCWHA